MPNPRKLPLMFLPAKFDSNDGLQRLGLAYMTKSGAPAPAPAPGIASGQTSNNTKAGASKTGSEPKKRKRRQSAPAQAAFKGAATRVAGDDSTGAGRPKKRMSVGLAKVDEDGEKA